MLSNDQIKELVGKQAADLVSPGMTIGIGTGSTAYWFIVALAERIKNGLNIKAVSTSFTTKDLALKHNIPLIEIYDAEIIDLSIDGADEINPQLQLIKGGGGSLLQEKIVANCSEQFFIIADETKLVKKLGRFPLPVEVVPFGWKQTRNKIEHLGCEKISLRMNNGKVFISDQGHYILDCNFNEISDPDVLHSTLNNIPGVVENGLFLNMTDKVLVGFSDGTIKSFR